MHKKLVMIFGTFDRIHPGHKYMFKEAGRYGKKLIAVVARDSVVRRLKNKNPIESERERMRVVRRMPGIFRVVLGDKKEGEYLVIRKYMPDIICLGYDQKALKADLMRRMRSGKVSKIRLMALSAYKPQKYHSSIVAKK